MLWTDDAALSFKERKRKRSYPSEIMPTNLNELHKWWDGQYMDKIASRLLIFAPSYLSLVRNDWVGRFLLSSFCYRIWLQRYSDAELYRCAS